MNESLSAASERSERATRAAFALARYGAQGGAGNQGPPRAPAFAVAESCDATGSGEVRRSLGEGGSVAKGPGSRRDATVNESGRLDPEVPNVESL